MQSWWTRHPTSRRDQSRTWQLVTHCTETFCSPSRTFDIKYWLVLQIVENQARQHRQVFGSHRHSGKRRLGASLLKIDSDCIIDVRVPDLEAASSYVTRDPAKILTTHEQQKKKTRKRYMDEWLQQRRSFCPFVISTDNLLEFEAKKLLKQLARHWVKRWYFHAIKSVNNMLYICIWVCQRQNIPSLT